MAILLINIVSGLLMLAIFLLIIFFDKKNNQHNLKQVKLICCAGVLVGLALTINFIEGLITNSILPSQIFKIKVGNFALVLIGFVCGGMLGLISGVASDVVGLLIAGSSGTFNLFFTMNSVLWCVLPYYLVRLFSKVYYHKWSFYWYLPIAYGITLLLITFSVPLVLKEIYNWKMSWWLLYLPRLIKYPIALIVNTTVIIRCYVSLSKILSLETQFQPPHFMDNK